uniref:Uncharacterized protein n=2 Tax=Brassica campestris TaxID=3711 RepID=M4DKU2_BRACM
MSATDGEANREAVNDGRSETQIKMKPGSTRRIAGENDADEATVSRRQKPAKLVPNKPPLPGDRAGRPPMEIVRRRKQKPIGKTS